MLFPKNDDVDRISKEVHNSLDGRIKILLDKPSVDCEDEERHCVTEFDVIFSMSLFISLQTAVCQTCHITCL
jgi:hypothetical protein